MKLADYLFQTGMSPGQLREALGLRSRSAVSRYLHGERIPAPPVLRAIIKLTGGAVQLEDFYAPGNPACATVITLADGKKRLVFPWSGREKELVAANDADRAMDVGQERVSEPVRRALKVIADRILKGPGGVWLLDGRPADHRRVVREANLRLRRQGLPPIEYPGVEGPW